MKHLNFAFILNRSNISRSSTRWNQIAASIPASLAVATIVLALISPIHAQTPGKSRLVYDVTNNDADWAAAEAGDQFGAQPFVTGELGIVSSVSIPFEPVGTPGGVYHIEIWDDDGEDGLPGSRIASLGDVDLEALPAGMQWVTFNNPVTDLEPDSVYYLVISYVDAELGTFPNGNANVKEFLSKDEAGTRGAGELLILVAGQWVPASDLLNSPNDIFWLMTIVETPMGFLGHEVNIATRYYNGFNVQHNLSPYVLATPRVGDGVELEANIIDVEGGGQVGHGDFDLAAFTIDVDEGNLSDFENLSGIFNGYIIEDKNGTLPDFLAVTVDESVSNRSPKDILVSPNSIWVNDEGATAPPNAYLRLIVTFADTASSPNLSLSTSPGGDMILEAPAQVGQRYQFEQSADLVDFVPIDKELTAAATFVATIIKPSTSRMFYRLRPLQ